MHSKTFKAETAFISPEGLNNIVHKPKSNYPQQNILWTVDYRNQLPIRVKKQGVASEKPITLNQAFLQTVKKHGQKPALSQKIDGKWITQNYHQYFQNCLTFGKALIDLGVEDCTVNIVGFNAPHWNIAFFGSMFSRCIPVGIYTTNSKQVCQYIAEQAQCRLVVAQNLQLALKYQDMLKKGIVKYIVLYRETALPEQTFEGRIMLWKDFMTRGKRVENETIMGRLNSANPGNCCTIVYTSGTTGLPKGVMLSHDNYTFLKRSLQVKLKFVEGQYNERIVSFLPLSHAAAQFSDVVTCMMGGFHLFFAEPDALQGGLIKTLLEVRPTVFFSVPRVWEKIYQKMMTIARSNGWLKTKLATWAKQIGAQELQKQKLGQSTSFQYSIAKMLVYNNVKKALGLDESRYFIFGAAPLHSDIRQYFMSLGMFLLNGYGMSECAGPETLTNEKYFKVGDKDFMREAGTAFDGTQLKIVKSDPNEKDGQICYRGRNVFMGYYKNREQTAKTIDEQGFLHSGDLGYLNEDGVLFITGRLKQLIITAAGQNIPPLLIQQSIKQVLPWISNIILVGENRKHLTCLITLLEENGKLSQATIYEFEKANIPVKTLSQAIHDPSVYKLILAGINKANQKAISRAQTVKSFAILSEDFSTQNGLLTPSLKMKRKEILKKFTDVVEKLYRESKL